MVAVSQEEKWYVNVTHNSKRDLPLRDKKIRAVYF